MEYKSSTDTIRKNQDAILVNKHPIRILHVVGSMELAGVETTLMHMLRRINRDHFQMDFLVHTDRPCAYDDEIRALDSQIIPCLNRFQPWVFADNFERIIQKYGSYDIIHSHVHHFGGYVLRLAYKAGIPVRIAHSRINTSAADAQSGLLRRLYIKLMEKWTLRYSTFGLSSSRQAAECLFGSNWENDPRWQTILVPARDFTPFQEVIDSAAVRTELNIPTDAFVIGHVGRFEEQKNHKFLIDVMAEVAKRNSKTWLLLIGKGSLRPDIEQKVAQMGLKDRVVFADTRSDVPRLMLGAMNLFLFPSLYEGLGSVGFEAQAAGLPCIFADVIPEELDVVEPLIKRLSLSKPAQYWAEEILTHRHAISTVTQSNALELIKNSQFNIETSLKKLEEIYHAQVSKKV